MKVGRSNNNQIEVQGNCPHFCKRDILCIKVYCSCGNSKTKHLSGCLFENDFTEIRDGSYISKYSCVCLGSTSDKDYQITIRVKTSYKKHIKLCKERKYFECIESNTNLCTTLVSDILSFIEPAIVSLQ